MMILFASLSGSQASAVTFVPAGTSVTAIEDSILLTIDEGKDIAAYTKSTEIRATLSEQALQEINDAIIPMQQDLSELRTTVNAFPEMVRVEVGKAYRKGLLDGGLVGLLVGAGITFSICR